MWTGPVEIPMRLLQVNRISAIPHLQNMDFPGEVTGRIRLIISILKKKNQKVNKLKETVSVDENRKYMYKLYEGKIQSQGKM